MINVQIQKAIVEEFNLAGLYLVIIVVVVGIILVLIVYIYHKFILHAFDNVHVLTVVRGLGSFGDFMTDLLFSVVLFFDENSTVALFVLSFTFVLIPYILSLIMCVYWAERWSIKLKTAGAERIQGYLSLVLYIH